MGPEYADVFKEVDSSIQVLNKFGNGRLGRKEFGDLCQALFRNGNQPYELSDEVLETLFQTFDLNKDGFICATEFESCYADWIRPIVNPVSVLVVVDVQNDFISGSLALRNAPAGQEGKEVIKPINRMLEAIPFKKVFYTKDWHPQDHISFIDNVTKYPLHKSCPVQDPKMAKVLDTVIFSGTDGEPIPQCLWPAHCIQESWGSELDPELKVIQNSQVVCKGLQHQVDSYSAFLDNDKKNMTPLKMHIDHLGAKDVYVCGLAYDICVGATAIDSLELGFRTVVLEDASKGVDLEGIKSTKAKILGMGGVITETDKVDDMVAGNDRRPELGLYLAKTLRAEKLKGAGENNNQPNKKRPRVI